jgi:hypothetical protein
MFKVNNNNNYYSDYKQKNLSNLKNNYFLDSKSNSKPNKCFLLKKEMFPELNSTLPINNILLLNEKNNFSTLFKNNNSLEIEGHVELNNEKEKENDGWLTIKKGIR